MSIVQFPTVCIKTISENDLPAASQLMHDCWHACYKNHVSTNALARHNLNFFHNYLNKKSSPAWLAFFGDKLAGLISLSSNCVDDLWVKPEFQRKKLGTLMLQAASEHLKEQGFISIQTGLESFNSPGQNFFKSMDWKTIGSEDLILETGQHVKALVLSKAL